jgi:Na+/alanine symporter
MDILLMAIGIYFITFAFIMTGKNLISKVILQVIPFFCGAYCIFYAIANMGIISLNM